MTNKIYRLIVVSIFFLVLFGIAILFSYMRPVDGPLQVGFPIVFYTLPSGFQPDLTNIHASWNIIALVLDFALILLVACLLMNFFEN